MTTRKSVRCAIYTRKSTEEGLEQDFNSLDAQRESGAAYIASQKAEGWTALPARYDDGGYSGGTLERPALKQLLSDIEDGKVDVVVVYKIDRLSRSLMDFAKLVEVFDRKGVTFVSVTQSFNTTTSMGRLTLNVLLSFAQFEREVTGERIRDKFAASKKKGMWMGGNPPLGYDVAGRKLVINEREAATVRLIFQRYLDLGCARLLCADLVERRVVSKRRMSSAGEPRGGKPIGRSALYLMLKNRTYIGKVTHKGQSYPGEHQGIVSADLFDAVQERLAELAPPLSGKPQAVQDAPYAGLVFDETGTAMLPTYAIKHGNLRYRYYVSRPALKGEKAKAAISRIPAPSFEAFMAGVMERLTLQVDHPMSAILQRVDVLSNSVVIRFDRTTALAAWRTAASEIDKATDRDVVEHRRSLLASGETLHDDNGQLILTLPVRARFRGGRSSIVAPASAGNTTPQPDIMLVKAMARAWRWRQMLKTGEVNSTESLAKRLGQDRSHLRQILNLAFLSPTLIRSIVRGEQPPGLRLARLLATDMPLSWATQEDTVARLAAGP